jgi:thiol-disulfide isomerase/thioredoxin
MNKKFPILIVFIILVGLIFMQNIIECNKKASAQSGDFFPQSAVKNKAPSFSIMGLDGRSYGITGQRDKPVMLNFWESWCGPCEEEAPYLKLIYEKYKDQFDIYAVNTTNKDNLESVKSFVKQYRLPFPILLDGDGNVSDLYRVTLYPTSFLIDRKII